MPIPFKAWIKCTISCPSTKEAFSWSLDKVTTEFGMIITFSWSAEGGSNKYFDMVACKILEYVSVFSFKNNSSAIFWSTLCIKDIGSSFTWLKSSISNFLILWMRFTISFPWINCAFS